MTTGARSCNSPIPLTKKKQRNEMELRAEIRTSELTGDPMNTTRFRNIKVAKSVAPEGLITAGMIGGAPLLAALIGM